ncbi:MAG: DNA polymerase III subunit delta [Myxococcales bacterium]|jgi:DNA polymerase-3 subunit delta|nr:DNA polymerase III subunit delta [Myxococcales bacterium]
MSATTLPQVLKQLDAGERPSLFLLSGDELLIRRSSDALVAKLLTKPSPGFNHVVLEGASASDVVREVTTAPMFRGPKIVVVRDPEFLLSKKGRGDALAKIKDAWSAGKRRIAANRILGLFAKAGLGVEALAAPDPGVLQRELGLDLEAADIAFLKSMAEFCQTEGIGAPEGGAKAFEDLLGKGLPEGHALIVEATQLDGVSGLVKRLKKEAVFIEQKVERELRKLDIHDLAAELLTPFKKRLSPRAEERLKDLCGGNLRLIQGELEKLATYVGAERATIEEDDVTLLVQRVREEEFREVSDALGARKFRDALHYVEVALDQGEPALKLHGAIASNVRRMLEDRARWSRLGLSPRIGQRDFEARGLPELERECKERGVKVPHPYVCWLGFQACMRYELGELVRGLSAVADADVELKSGGQARQTLTRMLVRIVRK